MRVLGLDISSTTTGYATLSNGRLLKSSTGNFKMPRGAAIDEKLMFFKDNLEKVLKKSKPDVIVIEDVFIGHRSSIVILARFSGVAIETCSRYGVVPILYTVTHIRKTIGCKNKKEEAFKHIKNKFGKDSWCLSEHNDIADAAGAAWAYIEKNKST